MEINAYARLRALKLTFLLLTALLADFLRKLATEEIPPAVRLLIGQVFPEWDGRALNVSWQAVKAAVDVWGPSFRVTPRRIPELVQQVREAAGAVSVRLGGTPS